jgi:class 3 adenylate cyclase/tetratricopeptide (TPR) repeat protein
VAACHQCGSELPGGARFCPDCGARVNVAAAEERKVVSVLFADLVGSTAAASTLDPEDVRAAVQPQLARMREELDRFGGTVEKYVGDAVMAVFGAPVAHEDDAERAVRAALAIRDALGPSVKVAVNTGEAVVAVAARPEMGDAMATGDVLNTTYRIEEATPPGAVLVGDATYRATGSAIAYGERRLVAAKGKDEPLVVWEALHARGAPGSPDDRTPLAPLVGRKEELALVVDTVVRAKRDRTVQLLTLVGAPGIGKSRLVWELQRALADDPGLVTWRRGRCLPYGDAVTFWALGEMVKEQAGILETDDARAASAKLHRSVRDLVADPQEAEWVEAHLAPVVGLTGELPIQERPTESFTAWRRFFEALADWGPLVLVFEDVHWADDGLLEFLDHLADWATSSPLVLLCTARPEIHERRPQWGARRNAATISLPPLSEAETGRLLTLLLRQAEIPPDLARTVIGHAEGNPLYTEEFIRMLVERSLLQRDRDGWQLRASEFPLPESVHGIIASRLDALPTQQKALLHDAAVVGRAFWLGAVVAMSGQTPADAERALRALEQREFVRRERASSVADDTEFVFRHTLVREVAYNQIPRAHRSQKHLGAANWLDEVATSRQDRVELLAHHLWKATVLARAVGRDDPELGSRARVALREAGERALALNSFEAAGNYFSAALDIAPGDNERPSLHFGYGKSLVHSQGTGDEQLNAAREGFLAIGKPEAAAEADVLCARLLLMQGRHADAAKQFDRALDLVTREPDSAAKAVVLANVAGFRMATDRGEEAIALADKAVAIASRFELRELQIAALATIGTARVSMGDASGVEDLEESIRIASDVGSPEIVRAYLNLGSVFANLGDVRRAAELHARGREAAQRFGDPTRLRWFVAERLYELYWSDRWDDALEVADAMLDEIREGAPHVAAFDAYLVRGWIRLGRGDVDAAVEDAERALDLGRSFGGPQLLYPALAFAARARLSAADREGAARLATELLAAWGETKNKTLPSFWVADLAVVMRALDRGPELEHAASNGVPSTRWLDAATAVARGDDERARELYAAIGSRPDAALISSLASPTSR